MIFSVLLAYNEEPGIEASLTRVDAALRRQGRTYRLLVVDDGSTDKTAEKVVGLASSLPVDLLRHPANRGVGRAFDTGLRRAAELAQDDDVILTLEADGTNDPAALPEMLARLDEGCDVVCASRYRPGGRYVGFPWLRKACSVAANWSLRLLFPVPGVRDYTIFYRAYRARAVRAALARFGDSFIESPGFASNAEILYKLAAASPLICGEAALVYRYDLKKSGSKMRVWRSIREYGRLFPRLAALRWFGRRTAPR